MDYGGTDQTLILYRHYVRNGSYLMWIINAWQPEKFLVSKKYFQDVCLHIMLNLKRKVICQLMPPRVVVFVNKHSTLRNQGVNSIKAVLELDALTVPWMLQTINVGKIAST
jgi:hypothetical protein